MSFTIGSLFDGSGGFPLAAVMCGGIPKWASEIEPYPIAVTKSRIPSMKHLGDISKINGAEVEPVDVISFGSPCQDLSVAGKRAGLKHEANGDEETTRSGLFMEAVRIIKEMREATHGKYPRFALWENVPGAFSSNKGEDFRIVLEELIKIVEPGAVMPPVPKKGWAYADSYIGDGWSLAYRVFDAQYWGVPQRRRRIYLVLDLGGECAGKISFERDGLRGYFTKGRAPWQRTSANAEGSVRADDSKGMCYGIQRQLSGVEAQEELAPTILAAAGESGNNKPCVAYGISSYDSNAMKSANPHSGIYMADTSRTLDLNGGNPACNQGGIAIVEAVGMDGYNGDLTGDKAATLGVNCGISTGRNGVIESRGRLLDAVGADLYNQAITGDKAATLSANSCMTATRNGPSVIEQRNLQQTFVAVPNLLLDDQGGQQISVRTDDKCPTLRAEAHGNVPCVVEAGGFCPEQSAKTRGIGWEKEMSPTLRAGVTPGVCITLEPGIAAREGGHIYEGVAGTLRANAGDNQMAVAYSIENHPADSRVSIDDSGKVQTLTSRMGTGGGNVPMVMERQTAPNVVDVEMEVAVRKYEVDRDRLIDLLRSHKGDFTNAQIAEALHRPLTLVEHWFRRDSCFAVPDPDVWFRLKRLLGIETTEFDACITEYEFKGGNYDMRNRIYTGEVAPTLTGGCGNHLHLVSDPTAAYGVDCRNGNESCELYPTLQAKPNGGYSLNFSGVVRENYIVRRLTPTECARLQGFPDDWGHIEKKDSLASEELAFWQEVRNTYASINDKAVKEYTEKQMLTWYNKLHTDSAEYKMWGNGIALPTALYCMEGIAEVLNERKGSLGLHPAESL